MPQAERPTVVDRAVDLLARGMDAFGLNGTRLRWKWSQRRRELGESGVRAAIFWRSTRGQHKMCPSCRALVPRSARTCTECGAGLSAVKAPGLGRLLSNVLPGATAATSVILLVNGVLFLMMLMAPAASGGDDSRGWFAAFDGPTLVRFGSGVSFLSVERGEWWRLVTPIFLHGGLIHFAFNSYALLQLGPLVDEEFGTERFAVVYVASGVLGNMTSQFLRPVNTVGASGAICGLIGLLLVHGVRRGGVAGRSLRSAMTEYAVYILVLSVIVRGIDLLCHAGGFLGGFVLGWVVPSGPFRSRTTEILWEALVLGAILVVLLSFYQLAVHGEEDVRLVFGHG